MENNEIKKALEYCANGGRCLDCQYDNGNSFTKEGCMASHMRYALALINSQEQRIKELNEEDERLRQYEITYETPSGKRTMPNLLSLDGDAAELYKRIEDKVKADTVREMQTRFAVHFGTYTDKDMTPIIEVFRLLDQIAKEMLEGEK